MALPNSENIISQLAKLPDMALKQMAMMHKADPYVLPLIISEDGRRKQVRQAAQAQMAGMQQPKVADAAVDQMGAVDAMGNVTGYAAGGLPEDMGIARLPARNIERMADGGIAGYDDGGMALAQHSEPVIRMADGGVPGYKNGDSIKDYEDRIRAEAVRQGVDPDMAVRLFTTESGGKKNAVSPKGAAGLGQLMIPAAKEMGLKPNERFDPEKNIPASIGYLKKQLVKYEGDPEKALAAYNWGSGNVDKHLVKNEGKLNKVGLPKETADYLTKILPMGSARAEDVPKAASADLASQIPGYSPARSLAPGEKYNVPASTYDQTNSYFGQLADKMGIPLEYQRNISNTMNALGGYSSPVSMVNRGVGMASKALEATPEMIAKAQQAKQIAETPRLLPPAKAGLEALDAASLEARAAAEAARRTRQLEQDRKAAQMAEQSVRTADETANIARTTEEAIAAVPNTQAMNAAKAANAARTMSATQFAEQQLGGGATQMRPEVGESVSGNYDTAEAPKPAKIIAAVKEAVPAKERKGYDNEDLLMLGLNLMANKSRNTLTAVGEAGIATLGAKREREKTAAENLYKEALIKQAERPASEIQLIEKYQKDPEFAAAYDKFAQSKREPMTREAMLKSWSSSPYLQMTYQNPEDYIKMMASAAGGGALGTQLSAADQSLVQKYLR